MTTPGKTTPSDVSMHSLVQAWLKLEAIAPGREVELAEALSEIIAAIKMAARGDDINREARYLVTKLGLNEGSK